MALFNYTDSLSEIKAIGLVPIINGFHKELLYTFCVPTYKRCRDLEEALDSIFELETEIPYNVIVADNNPEREDETEKLLTSKYSDKGNLTYFKNSRNLGMAGNWNRLILECKTPYMILFHDDDVLLPSFLSRMDEIRRQNVSVSALNSGKIRWEGKDLPEIHKDGKLGVHTAKNNYCKYLFGPPSGCLFKIDDLREIGGFDSSTYPSIDYVAILKLCLTGKLVLSTTEELLLYRVGENATAKLETQLKWLDIDYQIKTELKDILKISDLKYKIALWFEIKMRLRAISKYEKKYKYKNYTAGGKVFCLMYSIYDCLCRSSL